MIAWKGNVVGLGLKWQDLLLATGLVFATSLLAEAAYVLIGVTRLGTFFVAAVVVAAAMRGRAAGVVAALLGVPAYNLLMVPRGGITPSWEDAANLAAFLMVALVVGSLAGSLKARSARIQAYS